MVAYLLYEGLNNMKTAKRSQPGSGKVIRCRVGPRPKDDDSYFEQMTKVIFRSGLNWDVIENKWGNFHKAFAGFSVATVARFNESDVDRLLEDRGIVRNRRKVRATIENAQVFLSIRKEHGSFARYLREIRRDGEAALCRAITERFSFLGGSTVVFFLRTVGEEMPETIRQWEAETDESRRKRA
ncbi:MAG: DNA-3-methyladenine glycosylase I [Acidobacteria bacterium]|nr:DNA-3-methyladenine glycosylase I [Acidobacteriota bacterium]MBI3663702.1 DNA-3-methyladenine glycosylase I [Acidobacteriota bacterium]